MDSWTYMLEGESKGPVSLAELKKLARERIIQRDTLVWEEGTSDWIKASSVADLFVAPPPLPGQAQTNREPPPLPIKKNANVTIPTPSTPQEIRPKRSNTGFKFEETGVGHSGPTPGTQHIPARQSKSEAVATAVPPANLAPESNVTLPPPMARPETKTTGQAPSPQLTLIFLITSMAAMSIYLLFFLIGQMAIAGLFGLLGFGLGITQIVMACLFIKRGWECLPVKHRGNRSPGEAVGFLFVPLYNFYWVFVAVGGLTKGANRMLTEKGYKDSVSVRLANLTCVFFVCIYPLGWIPFLGPLICAASCSLFGLWVMEISRGLARAIGAPDPVQKLGLYKGGLVSCATLLFLTSLGAQIATIMWEWKRHSQDTSFYEGLVGGSGVFSGYRNAKWGMTKEQVERANGLRLYPGKDFLPADPATVCFEATEIKNGMREAVVAYWFRNKGSKGLKSVRRREFVPVQAARQYFEFMRKKLIETFGLPARTNSNGALEWNHPNSFSGDFALQYQMDPHYSSELEAAILFTFTKKGGP